jgi:hypothetical protein
LTAIPIPVDSQACLIFCTPPAAASQWLKPFGWRRAPLCLRSEADFVSIILEAEFSEGHRAQALWPFSFLCVVTPAKAGAQVFIPGFRLSPE